jgi:hypothetical protein
MEQTHIGSEMKLRVAPSALSLILSGGIPGLIAVMPAPTAAAKSAYTVTDLGNLGGGVSLGFGINASGEVVGRSYLDKVFFSSAASTPAGSRRTTHSAGPPAR